MKLFDVHTALGHWPFRRIPNQTAEALRRLLAAKGVAAAAVVNTQGLFYKNCHDANLELADWIAPHRDFFIGVATLNPLYAAWERDLGACRDKLGFRALRLAPQYHDYKFGNDRAVALVQAATEFGWLILVPQRLVDIRQRHWMDTERTIAMAEVTALCEAVPQARFILTEALGLDGVIFERYPGIYLESSRLRLRRLPAAVTDHVVFGSGAPFKGITPALLALNNPAVDDATRRKVGWDTAAGLIGIPGQGISGADL